MTKKHWVPAVASIMAVCALVGGKQWLAGVSYVLPYIVMIVLPWVTAYKNRRGILICVAVIALCSLLPPSHVVYEIWDIAYWLKNGSSSYTYNNYLYELADLLSRLLQIVFCVLIVIRMKKPIGEWTLYVCPVLQIFLPMVLLFMFVLQIEFRDLPYAMAIIWWKDLPFLLPPIVLMISAYLLVSEKLERIDVKEVMQSVSIQGDETGYTYLDVYKKNMRK